MHLIPRRYLERSKMATRLLIIGFAAILAMAKATEYPTQCPPDEVFSECGNNGCQNTCANPDIAAKCKAPCRSGCICTYGYLRNTKGECVPAAKCDTCKPNEIVSLCGNPECESTCSQPDMKYMCNAERCIGGCVCGSGYMRNELNECVKHADCKTKCIRRENEEFHPCGDICPKGCFPGKRCFSACISEGGCVCEPGYVRGPPYSTTFKTHMTFTINAPACIKPEQCPPCPINEVISCGMPCEKTCATLGDDPKDCAPGGKPCTEVCVCKEAFARDRNGICIPIEHCPTRQCEDDPNAIILPCGDPCPRTCENKDETGPRSCPEKCIKNGCKCDVGFVLGGDGKCIPIKDCPSPIKCEDNEIYDKCPPECPPEKTCSTYMSGVLIKCVPTNKCIPGCRCKEGYIRNVTKGKCILPPQCCKDPNSEFVKCPNPCPGGTLAKHSFEQCKAKCRPYGCQCKKGYVKKSDTDPACILIHCNTYPKTKK
ncbi:zonadhesin-like [Arctopsyche grandis]|uniref:zonadhesin-like n=1 Tax=Arctopsyche grandis TaxID=121162 RepID=UPI00406D78F3